MRESMNTQSDHAHMINLNMRIERPERECIRTWATNHNMLSKKEINTYIYIYIYIYFTSL